MPENEIYPADKTKKSLLPRVLLLAAVFLLFLGALAYVYYFNPTLFSNNFQTKLNSNSPIKTSSAQNGTDTQSLIGGGAEQTANSQPAESLSLVRSLQAKLEKINNDLQALEDKTSLAYLKDKLNLNEIKEGDVEITDNLILNSTAKTESIIPQSDDNYDLGSEDKGFNNAYVHKLFGSSILTVGDGETSHDLIDTDDLLISGNQEVNGNSYFDGDVTFGGTINGIISSSELGFLNGVTSEIQTQFSNLDIDIDALDTAKQDALSPADTDTSGYLTYADWNTFNSKQNAITPGTSLQYYTGEKTWATLNQAAVDGLKITNSPTFAGLTLSGILNMGNNAIQNIGAIGTDFTGTGGLTLADALTVSAGGINVTGASTFNDSVDFLGLGGVDITNNLGVGGDITAVGNADVGGDLTVTGSIISGSVSNSLVIGNEGYIDFEEGGSGSVTIGGTGNTYNESLKYDFESEANKIKVSSGSGATEISYVGITVVPGYTKMLREIDALLPLKLAIGFTTPSNNELDSISQSNLTYKNVAYSEIQTLGGVNQLITTGNNEYICTGTNSTCANDVNYSFPETGVGSGFIMGGYLNFTDVATSQVLFSKYGAGQTTREYRLIYNGASTKTLTFLLNDPTNEDTCNFLSVDTISTTGWKSIFIAYDGFGTTAANSHVRMWINGIPVTRTLAGCTAYVGMTNVNTVPFMLGAQTPSTTAPWLGNFAPFIIADQPDSANLSSSPTSYDDEILNIHNIMTSHLGL